ncbi:Glucose-1-phosphate adenylyltransferase [Salmonella enterica subsp. enterica serovar Daytona]|uniref:Glucose-1-phosphate adenylyltransferase n=1 Tax=Salmonella enterica subsp. enterica serovar Daytona TaxID=1962639 RepID=A0A447JAX1_SALET|nr:Glucose-1-phosphate adenylyltransferase [Salmonella enterica subsp. enterica serovar Daytona]
MVSLEKNDRVMLARQLPLKICCPNLGRRPRHASKDLTNKRAKPARPLWWEVPHHRFRLI